jgi:hypothetical protein
MELVPPLRATRFEQLEPGELFILLSGSDRFYALKTAPAKNHDDCQMVVLGPTFLAGDNESFLLSWQPTAVLSYGKNFSIIPSRHPEHWLEDGNRRTPVCIAVAEDQVYICTNGGHSPGMYTPRFVNIATGEIAERRLPNSVFTAHWRIEIVSAGRPPLILIEFPSPRPQSAS